MQWRTRRVYKKNMEIPLLCRYRDSMNFFHLSLTGTLSASLPTLCTPKSYLSLGIVLQDEGCPRQQYLLFLSV